MDPESRSFFILHKCTLAVVAWIMYIKQPSPLSWPFILVHPLLRHPKILCLHTCAPICVGLYTQERVKHCIVSILVSLQREKMGQSYVICNDHEGNPQETRDWGIISNLPLYSWAISPLLTAFPRDIGCFMISTNKNLPWYSFCLCDGCLFNTSCQYSLSSLFSS